MTDIFWFFLYCIGALIGYGIATYVSGSREGVSGRVPSLRFRIGQYTMWIHHWIYFSIIIIGMVLFDLSNPVLYGFCAGAWGKDCTIEIGIIYFTKLIGIPTHDIRHVSRNYY